MAEQLAWKQPHWKIWHLLPLHPQPATLESLTSYLTRVAQANGLQKGAELVTAAGTQTSWKTLRSFPDGSATSVLGLTTLTGCTQTDLEAMTFLPLARQFGRANSTRTLRRFLEGSLVPHLRYCPLCLSEHDFPYYRLHWRFLILSGCLIHRCQLLDHCGFCGGTIPLLASRPDLSTCPTCSRNLGTCQSLPLSENEEQLLTRRTSDLLFLLGNTVQSQEEDPRALIGKHYSFFRQQRGLSLQEVFSQTPQNPKILLDIEHAGLYGQATFLDYLQYADLLNSSLKEIWSVSPVSPPLDEETLLAQVDETIRELRNQTSPGRHRRINSRVGIPIRTLKQYPRISSHLWAWRSERHYTHAQQDSQREEELVQVVMSAIQQLEALKQPVTQAGIARLTGMTYQSLRVYPKVEAILMQVASKHPSSKPQSYRVSGQNRLLSSRNEKEEAAE